MWAATALLEQYKSVVNVHLESQLNAREHEASIPDKNDTKLTRGRRVRYLCRLYQIPRNKSLQQIATIISISEETNGCKVYLRM